MKYYLSLYLLLFSFVSFAQIATPYNNEESDYSNEAPSELETTNRGVFINTSFGVGISSRTSTGTTISDKVARSIPLAGIVEVGISRNWRLGATIERDGNRVSSDDSLKIFSLNYGVSLAYRVINTPHSFYYVRANFGFSDMQVSGAAFVYGNIQDSIVITSKNGLFINVAFGQQIVLQKGVNFFYQAKVGYAAYPKIESLNFVTNERNIVPSDDPSKPLKLKYIQVFIEVGFSFKL